MTKKAKLTIIASVAFVLVLSLLVAYFILYTKGVWQEDILATEYDGYFWYNNQTYRTYSGIWSYYTEEMEDMGGYIWKPYPSPFKRGAYRMYGDNLNAPIFIYSKKSGPDNEYVLKDFEFPTIFQTSYTKFIITAGGNSHVIDFVDDTGMPENRRAEDLVDFSTGFDANDLKEDASRIGALQIISCDYPCLCSSYMSIYSDGENYFLSIGWLIHSDEIKDFYPIIDDQVIEYCKMLYIAE